MLLKIALWFERRRLQRELHDLAPVADVAASRINYLCARLEVLS